jgi:hypothetical protein
LVNLPHSDQKIIGAAIGKRHEKKLNFSEGSYSTMTKHPPYVKHERIV